MITVPYSVKEDAVVAGGANAQYNGYAHSFAGMGIQFLLFAAIELGMGILLERELGIWKRFRSAPLSRFTLLAARGASGTVITLLTLRRVVCIRDGRLRRQDSRQRARVRGDCRRVLDHGGDVRSARRGAGQDARPPPGAWRPSRC